MNLAQHCLDTLAPDGQPAFVGPGDARVSHGALRQRHWRLRAALARQGVKPGDRVAILLGNRAEFIEVFLAIVGMGATSLLINKRLSPAEKLLQLNDAEPVLLVCDRVEAAVADAALQQVSSITACWRLDTPGDPFAAAISDTSSISQGFADANHPAVLLYTSGTTSGPKGVLLTHRNIIANIAQYQAVACLPTGNVSLQLSPLYHAAIFFSLLHLSLGGTTVFIEAVTPELILQTIEAQRVNFVFAVPTVVYQLLDVPDRERHDLSSLTVLQYGAAPISWRRVDEAHAFFGEVLMHSYGMTETTSHVTLLGREAHREGLGSIGLPLPGVAVRLVDDEGHDVADGELGEIAVKGDNITPGYWRRPEATAAAFRDGWFLTGDLATRDATGRLTIAGRKKELIISGGVNIYPLDIENVLASHPAVAEAAVVGLPDPLWGEAVVAALVLRRGASVEAAALQDYVRERLAGFKVPKRVVILEALPRNAVGKIVKPLLAQQLMGASVV